MPRQTTTVYRPTPTNPSVPVPAEPRAAAIEDLDDFLDEVDGLLEDNALEVVRAFVQRSGQ